MPVTKPPIIFRLLRVEDDIGRMQEFRVWLPQWAKLVWVQSAGSAIGLIRRDHGHVYGGVLLDHDLAQRAMTADDESLSGTDVALTLVEHFSIDIPILIHSTNQPGPGAAGRPPAGGQRLLGNAHSLLRHDREHVPRLARGGARALGGYSGKITLRGVGQTPDVLMDSSIWHISKRTSIAHGILNRCPVTIAHRATRSYQVFPCILSQGSGRLCAPSNFSNPTSPDGLRPPDVSAIDNTFSPIGKDS